MVSSCKDHQAKRSMNQINQKRLSSHNIDTESLKTRFNKVKDARTAVFSCVPIWPLWVPMQAMHSAAGDPGAAHPGKAGLLPPAQPPEPSPFPQSCPALPFPFQPAHLPPSPARPSEAPARQAEGPSPPVAEVPTNANMATCWHYSPTLLGGQPSCCSSVPLS